jgi:hypothetical protein
LTDEETDTVTAALGVSLDLLLIDLPMKLGGNVPRSLRAGKQSGRPLMASSLPQILEMAQELRFRIVEIETHPKPPALALTFDEQQRFAMLMRRLQRHAAPFVTCGGRENSS